MRRVNTIDLGEGEGLGIEARKVRVGFPGFPQHSQT